MMNRPHLVIAAKNSPPVAEVIRGENGRLGVSGMMGEVVRNLADYLQIDYEIKEPPDGKNGSPIGNGSWNGMIGMILKGDAEFGVGPLSYSYQRSTVITYPAPIHYDNNALLIVRPTATSDIGAFLKPFPTEVWLSVFCSLVFIVFALVVAEKLEGSLHSYAAKDVTSNSCMWALKAFTQEGSEWLPKKDGGRVLVATWILSSLVFMSCYSGTLTAMLSAPKVHIPVNSLEDLVKQTKIPWKLPPGSFITTYLKASESPVHQKALHGSSGPVSNCWSNREQLATGKYALICIEVLVHSIMSWDFSTTGRCRLYRARKLVLTNNMSSLVFKKNSTYLEKTKQFINLLRQSGLFEHWRKSSLVNATQCLKPPSAERSGEGVAALNLEAFAGLFLLLGTGYLTSLVIFVIENGFAAWKFK